MKRLYLILALPVCVLCLAGCETTETTSSDTQVKTAASVPGEKTGDESIGASAGPGTAAAGVRW